LPSPYDLTGDKRWASDGQLHREYGLEFEDAADKGPWTDAVAEVVPDIHHLKKQIKPITVYGF